MAQLGRHARPHFNATNLTVLELHYTAAHLSVLYHESDILVFDSWILPVLYIPGQTNGACFRWIRR